MFQAKIEELLSEGYGLRAAWWQGRQAFFEGYPFPNIRPNYGWNTDEEGPSMDRRTMSGMINVGWLMAAEETYGGEL